jgi:hypothetical protein
MIPSEALITLYVINLSLVEIFLLDTTLKNGVSMIWAGQLKLSKFLATYF